MYQRITRNAVFFLILFCSIPTVAISAQYGQTTFPNSGASGAQASFMQGLLMLHSFEYENARAAFQSAREIDPDFAMAYWGEALTHYRVLWNEIELEQASKVLLMLGETPQARADKAATQREKDYLNTLELLLTEESATDRANRYAEALANLSQDYPDDENAAAFYALALLGSSGADRNFSIYMRSAAVSESIIAKNPLHPGAVHYLIHAYDDPVHAPLGLRSALTYADIAPAAVHALHMPSHIFFPLGMWKAASTTNARAYAAGQAASAKNGTSISGGAAHALTWLVYSQIQEGKYQAARDHLLQFQTIAANTPARLGQFVETWASYLVETNFEETEFVDLQIEAEKLPARRSSMVYYVKGAAAVKAGNIPLAEQFKTSLSGVQMKLDDLNWSEKAKDVMLLELEALILRFQGKTEAAIERLTRASVIEYAMPRRFGPPWPPKPSHELLGQFLLEQENITEASRQFKLALELANGRSTSLLGLAMAESALNQHDQASRTLMTLSENWIRADKDLVQLKEFSQIIETNGAKIASPLIMKGILNED